MLSINDQAIRDYPDTTEWCVPVVDQLLLVLAILDHIVY